MGVEGGMVGRAYERILELSLVVVLGRNVASRGGAVGVVVYAGALRRLGSADVRIQRGSLAASSLRTGSRLLSMGGERRRKHAE